MPRLSGENRRRQKEQRPIKKREYGIPNSKAPKRRIYLFCEGERTEPLYFQQLANEIGYNITVDIDPTSGYNTISLVRYASEKRKTMINSGAKFDAYWVVFDKDDFDANFNNAIAMAKAEGVKYKDFKCAWSNEAFELWYILHFEFRHTDMPRTSYEPCLTQHLKDLCGLPKDKKYEKNDPNIFLMLNKKADNTIGNERTLTAIKNARKLEIHDSMKNCTICGATNCLGCNPRTKVHELVDYIINDDKGI